MLSIPNVQNLDFALLFLKAQFNITLVRLLQCTFFRLD